MGLKEKTSFLWNPQSNSILVKIKLVLRDCLTTFEFKDLDINKEENKPLKNTQQWYCMKSDVHFIKHTDILQDS